MVEKNTYSVSLFIKRKKLHKNGESPVFIRLTVRGERKEFSANMTIPSDFWDAGKGKIKNGVKDAAQKNQYLSNLVQKVHSCKRDLIERGMQVSAQAIMDAYLGNDEPHQGILEIFAEHNLKCEELSGKDFAPATVQKYKACRKIVGDFIKKKYRKNDIPINSIDHKFITELEHYIKTARGCSHNTTLKYLQNFRKIVLLGINYGWVKKDPFMNIKFRKEKTYPVYLDEGELDKIRFKKISIDRLIRVRDIFIFCCFTGLAYSDVKELQSSDIATIAGGKKCIKKLRHKTGILSYIPLLDIPERILLKYEQDPICQRSCQLLPVLSNQKMNAYLKELADICGIEKPITMHTARHTFATTVTLSNNISIEVVSEMLGHSSLKMTKHYARVVNNHISNEMSKIEKRYSSTMVNYREIVNQINYN